jgi:nucleoside-diphosphate kinase
VVQIFEPATRKTFLKRCEPPEGVAATDFFVGASVTLFSRQFKITSFADPVTERKLKLARSSTLGIITSDALQHIGSILSAAAEGGLTIGRAAMLALSSEQANDLVANRSPSGTLHMLPVLQG